MERYLNTETFVLLLQHGDHKFILTKHERAIGYRDLLRQIPGQSQHRFHCNASRDITTIAHQIPTEAHMKLDPPRDAPHEA
jgi:adenylate kinase